VILRDFGPNHATGVTVMHFPDDGVITTTDLAYRKRWRFGSLPNESPREILRSIREITEQIDFDLAITGHGPFATYDEVVEHGDFLEDLIGQVRRQIDLAEENNVPMFELTMQLLDNVDTSRYEDWDFYEVRDANIMGIYYSLAEGF